MTSGSQTPNARPLDPLDRARKAIEDGKAATKLLDYAEDFDEDTARHDITVTVNPQPTPPSPSQPQIEVSQVKPGVLTVALTVVQKFPPMGAVLVALAIIAGYVYLRAIGAVKWP